MFYVLNLVFVHRVFANALSEEVVKPLKQLIENQHRTRKAIETGVDKTGMLPETY